MSNFTAFNKEYLASLIDPFLPGASDRITPVKFQAITPDIFATLIRSTGQGGIDYFFVALEFDYLPGIDAAGKVIGDWVGSEVQQFFPPSGIELRENPGLEDIRVATAGQYYTVLALVQKPTNLGYWSDHIVLQPGDDLKEKLANLSKPHFGAVQKFIGERSDPKTKAPRTNTTPYAIAIYQNPHGGLEFFFTP